MSLLPQHWLLILTAFIAGYLVCRFWSTPGDMVGLPNYAGNPAASAPQ